MALNLDDFLMDEAKRKMLNNVGYSSGPVPDDLSMDNVGGRLATAVEPVINKAITPRNSLNGGVLAGVKEGFLGGIETGNNLAYRLGRLPGDIVRAKIGLSPAVPDPVEQTLRLRKATNELDAAERLKTQAENPNASLEQITAGGATFKVVPTEEDRQEEVKWAAEKVKAEAAAKEEVESGGLTALKKLENEKSFAEDMLNTIAEVEKGKKYFGAAGLVPAFPAEYSKVNWRANFDKLISQRVLNTLNELKKTTKTGATGFGQLSNKELGILMDASTALKRNMSEEDAQKYLNKMKEPLLKILNSHVDTLDAINNSPLPVEKATRLEELRRKKAEGTLK